MPGQVEAQRGGALTGLDRLLPHSPLGTRQTGELCLALITGITGQDGLYLSELLLSKGYEVYGLIRGQSNPKLDLVRQTVPEVHIITGDLTDMSSLIRALNVSRPDEVYNLGAISFVAYSWENAHVTTDVTGRGSRSAPLTCDGTGGGRPTTLMPSREQPEWMAEMTSSSRPVHLTPIAEFAPPRSPGSASQKGTNGSRLTRT